MVGTKRSIFHFKSNNSWSIKGILILTIVLLFSFFLFHKNPKPSLSPVPISTIEHSSHIFDPEFIKQAYDQDKPYTKIQTVPILGGIIPHHLLASPIIAGFFDGIKNQDIQTIILIGPNHFNTGTYPILVSNAKWKTIFGFLAPDSPKIDNLLKESFVHTDEDVFESEHSIYGITSFIKNTFPKARIIPIILKSSVTKNECDTLILSLQKIVDDKTIILASVDFSHFQSSPQADTYDLESIHAIQTYDADTIFSLNPVKNFDSPASIYTLVKIMQSQNAFTSTLISNTNSAKLTDQPLLNSTTSYVSMYFSKLTQNTDSSITIMATGDVIPARSVNRKVRSMNDFTYPFLQIEPILKKADAVLINLESPLIPDCKTTDTGMIFCSDPRTIEGLLFSHVAVANIANNHMGNYGVEGINSTIELLTKNNIKVSGGSMPAKVMIKNKLFGFLGYNTIGAKEPGVAWAYPDNIKEDIRKLKNEVDFVIVSFHWGNEYTSIPNSQQITLAHHAIDSGADLVIGNHPHWVGAIEHYKEKVIMYAHGNFIFDQLWSQKTQEGVIGTYTFDQNGLTDANFIPILIRNFQVLPAPKVESDRILNEIKINSSAIQINNQ